MIPELLLLELFIASATITVLKQRRLVEGLSVIASLTAALLSIAYILIPEKTTQIGVTLYSDALSKLMLGVVNVLGSLIVIYSVGYMNHDPSYRRYYSLMLFFIASMSLLVLTTNLLILYVSWELVGVCSALLISFWWDKPEARKAGLKAFTVTRIGDIGFIAAIALLLTRIGTSNIPLILDSATELGDLITPLAILLLLAAIGKSAQFPLFVWLPDAMEGPTSVSALIHAATMVKAGVYLLSRFYPLITLSSKALEIVVCLAIITIFLSALAALGASDIKRVLAYSTINHLALMFLGLGLGAWGAAQLHLLSHSLFKALLFLCAGLIIHEAKTRSLDELGGLWSSGFRVTGIGFLIGSLSLAGVPPLPGYFTKDLILMAIEHNFKEGLGYLLAFTISLLSSLYIFRLYFRLFKGAPRKKMQEHNPAMIVPIIVLSILTFTGILILTQASRMLGVAAEFAELDPSALLGLGLGILIAYYLWGKESYTCAYVRSVYKPLAQIADKGFYIDEAYSIIASKAINLASDLSRKLQTGIPSINTLWLIGLLLVILLIVMGVM